MTFFHPGAILLITSPIRFDRWGTRRLKSRFRLLQETVISSHHPPVKKLNTMVYIDGFNLYYSLKNTPYKWLDLKKLAKNILVPDLHKILKIKYFTALSVKRNSAQRQDVYLRALKTLQNIEIILGKFKKRQVKGVLTYYQNKKYIKQNEIVTSFLRNVKPASR